MALAAFQAKYDVASAAFRSQAMLWLLFYSRRLYTFKRVNARKRAMRLAVDHCPLVNLKLKITEMFPIY